MTKNSNVYIVMAYPNDENNETPFIIGGYAELEDALNTKETNEKSDEYSKVYILKFEGEERNIID